MPNVEVVLPRKGVDDAYHLVDQLRAAQLNINMFDDRLVAFLSDFSRSLRRVSEVRVKPALAALAHWIRPSNIDRLRRSWAGQQVTGRLQLPRGVVFHVPPTNVDTLFVYSWVLSALAGNANVIRLSPSSMEEPSSLISVLSEVLARHKEFADLVSIVTYAHDDSITEALSTSDMRVIWGGDMAVNSIRVIPRPPHSTELSFPNRFSLALISADAVLAASDQKIRNLTVGLYNDAYWFDQLGCASPRLIVWHGSPDLGRSASERLFPRLSTEVTRHGFSIPPSAVTDKLVHLAEMTADGLVKSAEWNNPTLTHAVLCSPTSAIRQSPGGGLFYESTVERLGDVSDFITRRDQTISYFGFSREEMIQLGLSFNSRGIDRIVPVGSALNFDRFWDGVDLLTAYSRIIVID